MLYFLYKGSKYIDQKYNVSSESALFSNNPRVMNEKKGKNIKRQIRAREEFYNKIIDLKLDLNQMPKDKHREEIIDQIAVEMNSLQNKN